LLDHLFMLPLADLFDPNTISGLIEAGGYFVIFGLLFACGLGLPLPEDIPLLCAGFLISQGKMHWVPAAIVAWLGIIGGDTALYHLGKRFGLEITRVPFVGKHLTPKRILKAEQWFARYGVWVVAIGRMVAGVRGAMVVAAGAIRFNFLKFIIADGLAAVVSGGLFLVLGWWLGYKLGSVEAIHLYLKKYEHWIYGGVLIVILGAILVFLLMGRWKKSRAEKT
jgi:membrane protein DedA with SNARE-associated domain